MRISGSAFRPGALAPARRARLASLAVGGITVVVGLSTLLGWVLTLPTIIQPFDNFAPLSFTASVGVLALGVGVLGFAGDHRRGLMVGGAAALMLGGAALFERATGIDLRMGLSPAATAASGESTTLFHIPASTAILFLCAGLGQLVFTLTARAERARLLAGALGSITVVLCLGILATRLVSTADAGHGFLAGSSVQAVGTSLLVGLDLVLVAWSADPSAAATAPWVPLSVGVGCLVTVILLWRTLLSYEREQARVQAVAAVHTVQREMTRQVETGVRAISRIARFSAQPRPDSPAWANAMLALTRDIDGLRGIAWTDQAAIVHEYRPTPIRSDTLQLQLQRRLASVIRNSGSLSSNDILYFALGDSGRTFAAAVPVCSPEECTGHIVAVFDSERLLHPILTHRGDGFAFQAVSAGTRILGPRTPPGGRDAWSEQVSFALGDQIWKITAWPTRETLKRMQSGLPDLLLLLGLLVAAILPVTLRLGQMTLTRARLAERVRLNHALETANDGIWEWDIASGVASRSATLWRYLGYDPAQVLPGMDSWSALIHPEDARRVRDTLADHLTGRSEAYAAQYRVRDRAGEWHWVIDRGRVVERSGTGAPVRMLGISADVTVRKRAEDALREAQSLTTMGRLAARVAHEINNPLAGIQNAFTLIKDAVPENHPHRPYVGAIEREIGRIAGVTRQLYETYRPEENPSGDASVSSVVGDAVALLQQLNRESRVRLTVDLAGAPPIVRLPDALLRQAVYNLVQNAIDASPPGGSVVVTALAEPGIFLLKVRDQGPGVPSDIRERIFEPFFSTKAGTLRTGGMGLGLAMVRQSVQAFGGRIDIVDPPEGGAEFVVRLPLTKIEPGIPT